MWFPLKLGPGKRTQVARQFSNENRNTPHWVCVSVCEVRTTKRFDQSNVVEVESQLRHSSMSMPQRDFYDSFHIPTTPPSALKCCIVSDKVVSSSSGFFVIINNNGMSNNGAQSFIGTQRQRNTFCSHPKLIRDLIYVCPVCCCCRSVGVKVRLRCMWCVNIQQNVTS